MAPENYDNPHYANSAPAMDGGAAEWERTYATWTHLAGLIGGITGAFSFGLSLLVVLILWLIKRDQSPFIDDHGREAVNFHLSLLIYTLLIIPLATIITCGLGAILLIPLILLAVIGAAYAANAAHKGRYFRYPATIRILRG